MTTPTTPNTKTTLTSKVAFGLMKTADGTPDGWAFEMLYQAVMDVEYARGRLDDAIKSAIRDLEDARGNLAAGYATNSLGILHSNGVTVDRVNAEWHAGVKRVTGLLVVLHAKRLLNLDNYAL